MEITPALVISVISIIFVIINFAINRKDKAVKDAKEVNMALIEFRLNELDKNVQKILNKLENYDEEVDKKITKALQHHIAEMHKAQ